MKFLVFDLWLIFCFTVVNNVLDSAKNLVRLIAKYAFDAKLFRLGSSILKHAGSRGAAPVGGVGGEAQFQIYF